MPRIAPCLAVAASLCAAASSAHAQHDVRAFLSPSGIEFAEAQLPSYVPTHLEPPTFEKSFACMDFIQRDTVVELSLDRVDIRSPGPGRLRVELDISGTASGELHADDIYACVGSQTCSDHLTIDRATAILEYDLAVVNGVARVMPREVSFELSKNDIHLEFSDCGFVDNVLNTAVDFTKGWILGYLEGKVEDLARGQLGGMLEDLVGGFAYEGSVGSTEFAIKLGDLALESGGVALSAGADIWSRYPAASCIASDDSGDPIAHDGPVPDLSTGPSSHVAFGVNLGLVDDALYHVWRRGLTCLTGDHLAALGLEIDYDHVAAMMPGFPPGTEMHLDLRVTQPPRVVGTPSADAELTLVLRGVEVDLVGERPDGTRNTLHAEVDVEATAVLGIDPASNAILLGMRGAQLTRLVMEDERTATGEGFDVVRLRQLLHEVMLPRVLAEVGEIPLTGPVFTFADYAILLRDLSTTGAYARLGADLFRIPADDRNAPETRLTAVPSGVVSAADAVIGLGGSDAEIPSELLRYRVTIDGEEQTLSFLRRVPIATPGVSRSYQVSVTALDLSGNEDATPESVTVEVDGVAPHVVIDGDRSRSGDGTSESVTWTMDDDLTAASELAVHVEVFRLADPGDVLTAELVDTLELPAGTTSAAVAVEPGAVYRIEVRARDAVGNESSSSLLLDVAGAGCATSGGGGGGLWLLALAAPLALRRRRRA